MEIIRLFSQLAPVVQLSIVIGSVALVFLIACSRQAGENLLLFLQGLRSVLSLRVERNQRKMLSHQRSQRLALPRGRRCRRES